MMNKIAKVAGITAGMAIAGIVGYTMINKKTRMKVMDIANTMVDDTKSMLKK